MPLRLALLPLVLLIAAPAAAQGQAGVRGTVVHREAKTLTGKTYALLIGISHYQSVKSLEYADKDAQLFFDFLTSALGGVAPENILLLPNERATRAAIDDAVKNFVEPNAGPENSLILFVAGHGAYVKSEVVNGKTVESAPYILTWDSNADDPKTTGYPMDEFRAMIAGQAYKFGRVLIYVDVCHAANIAGIGGVSEPQVGAAFRGAAGDLGLMVASSANRFAFESPSFGGGHGAFSYFLISGLNGAAVTSGADSLRWDELADYVRKEVSQYTNRKQRPADYPSDEAIVLISGIHDRKGIPLAPAEPLSKEDEQRESRNRQGFVTPMVAARSVNMSGEGDALSAAVSRGALLPEDFGSAYQMAAQMPAGTPERKRAERRVRVAMEDAGQQIVSHYLEGDQIPQVRDDFVRCARLFEEAFLLDSTVAFDNSRALFCRGRALIFDHGYQEAERLLRQSIQLDPKRSYAWNAIGISKLEQINLTVSGGAAGVLFDEAAEAFRTAMRYAPYWAYPMHNLALTLSERGDFDGAIRAYRAAMDIAPQYSYLPYNLGLLYMRTGDLAEAQRWFAAAVKIAVAYPRRQDGRWTEKAEALTALGTLSLRRHDQNGARRYFAEALVDDPKDPNTRQNLALLAAADRDYTKADGIWAEILKDSPSYVAARVAWAESLSQRGDAAGAIRHYKEILSTQMEWAGAHDALARLYFSSGDNAAALAEVNAALSRTPANPFLLELRGDIDLRLAHRSEAVADWNSALGLAPDKSAAVRIRRKLKAL